MKSSTPEFPLTSEFIQRVADNDPNLETLDLSRPTWHTTSRSRLLSTEDALNLAEALKKNTIVKTVDLSNQKIEEEGFEEGFKAIVSANKTITHFILNRCEIGRTAIKNGARVTRGIKVIMALAENNAVTHLDLSNNLIGDYEAIEISKIKSLTSLDVSSPFMQSIHSFLTDLTHSEFIKPKGAKAIAEMPNLRELNISGHLIRDDGAIELAKSESLEELKAGSNGIHEAGVLALAFTSIELKNIFSYPIIEGGPSITSFPTPEQRRIPRTIPNITKEEFEPFKEQILTKKEKLNIILDKLFVNTLNLLNKSLTSTQQESQKVIKKEPPEVIKKEPQEVIKEEPPEAIKEEPQEVIKEEPQEFFTIENGRFVSKESPKATVFLTDEEARFFLDHKNQRIIKKSLDTLWSIDDVKFNFVDGVSSVETEAKENSVPSLKVLAFKAQFKNLFKTISLFEEKSFFENMSLVEKKSFFEKMVEFRLAAALMKELESLKKAATSSEKGSEAQKTTNASPEKESESLKNKATNSEKGSEDTKTSPSSSTTPQSAIAAKASENYESNKKG